MKVGVFDSGIGGLTVLKELKNIYPHNEYIYYGDTLNNPYGSKTIDELNKLAYDDVLFLLNKNVDIIIIACGTVSSNCLEYLRSKVNIPIIDIITPVIDYINNSSYKSIGVIATERTIGSHLFKNKISKTVYEIKTPKFVPMIENNDYTNLDEIIDSYLKKYKDKIELLVLGCTHYPIISSYLSAYFNDKVVLLNMAIPLINILNKMDSDTNIKEKTSIYYSKTNENIINNTKKILNDETSIIEISNR